METLRQDLRFAARLFRKEPGITLLAVVMLAVAIGANTAIFSLVNFILLLPPSGIHGPSEPVFLERFQKGLTDTEFGYPDYKDFRDRNRTFAGLAAECSTVLSLEAQTTERVRASLVSGNYFPVLGVEPTRGRVLGPKDEGAAGESAVAVLSYDFWQRRFGADPGIVGRTIHLDRYPYTVVGVAARGFQGTRIGRPLDLFIPVTMQPQAIPRMSANILGDRAAGWLFLFGRLKPGVMPEQAQSDLAPITAELAREYPATNATRRVAVLRGFGLDPDDRADLNRFLGLLMVFVVLLLFLASSNVASLQLARVAARRREVAIRLAVGSGRARVLRQLLTENLALWLLGALAGLLVAPELVGAILAAPQPYFVSLSTVNFTPDRRVLAFTMSVTVATGVLFGLAPGLEAWRVNLTAELKEGSPSSSPRHRRWLSGLVIAQVCLAFILLTGAGLFARTLRNLLAVDRGFETRNILLLNLDLDNPGYSQANGSAFYEQLLSRVRTLPGIQSASLTGTVPPTEWPGAVSVFYEGQAPPPEELKGREFELGLRANIDVIASGYFQTFGIRLLEGRDFNSQDRADAPRVAIASWALAERLWPGQPAIGKRLEVPLLHQVDRRPLEIVGVARDTLHRSLLTAPPLLLYLPLTQQFDGRETLVIRSAASPVNTAEAIRNIVRSLDSDVPVFGIRTMGEHVSDSLWQQKLAAALVAGLGFVALALAGLGVYSVISHSVAMRAREIGVRMALGAGASDVLRLVVRQGMALAAAGIGIGFVAVIALGHATTRFLFGVSGRDPATLFVVCGILSAAALAASYFPGRRATGLDPLAAVRSE